LSCKWHSYSYLLLSHGFEMSLMSMASSMVVLWGAFDAQTCFVVHSLGWLYHSFCCFNVIVIPKSLHSRWSMKANSHQWNRYICLPTINMCLWFVLVFLQVTLVFGHFLLIAISKNIYSKTQILIDNQIALRIKFYSSILLNVLATDYFLKVEVNNWESLHQTYKSPLH